MNHGLRMPDQRRWSNMIKRIRPVVIDGDIVRVPLTRGLEAVVDLADLSLVEGRNWYAEPHRRTTYATTSAPAPTAKGWSTLKLHRVIMGFGPGDPHVDHIDHDGLNNQRSNLRAASGTQNNANSRPRVGYTSKFKGVHWHKQRQRWAAQIRVEGKGHHLGLYDDEVEAARAYDATAIATFGEFVQTNFPRKQTTGGVVTVWEPSFTT